MSGNYLLETNAPASKLVFLDSRDADLLKRKPNGEYFTTDLSYTFADLLVVPEHVDTLLSVHSATIPHSFYTIREFVNDAITFQLELLGVVTTEEVFVPPGNYDAPALAAEVQTLMGNGVVVTYNTNLLKLIFSLTTDCKITFLNSPTSDNFKQSIYSELGLLANDDIYFQRVGAVQTATYPAPPPLTGLLCPNAVDIRAATHNMHLRTDLTTTATIDSSTKNYSTILCRFPVSGTPGGVMNIGHMQHQALIKISTLKHLKLSLTDDRNRLIDLNGLNWSIALLFCFAYEKKPIQQLGREERRFISSVHDRHLLKERVASHKKKQRVKVNANELTQTRNESNQWWTQTRKEGGNKISIGAGTDGDARGGGGTGGGGHGSGAEGVHPGGGGTQPATTPAVQPSTEQ
jgi:hypothetical protein